jgi:hypothetical protein
MGLTQKLGTIPLAIFTDASNNVGIAVTPTTRLTIGRVDSSSEGAQIDLCRASDNFNAWGIDVFGNTTTPSFRILDNVAGAARMIIDGTGRVGFGLTPTYTLDVASSSSPSLRVRNGALGGTSTLLLETANNFSGTCQTFIQCIGSVGNGTSQLAFGTAGASGDATATERMRINGGGQLLVNTTSSLYPNVKFCVKQTLGERTADIWSNWSGDQSTTALSIIKFDNVSSTSQVFQRFVIDNGNVACGQINGNGANQAAFGSWSDIRLKENVENLPSQLSNIMALRPVEFDYKNGSGHQIGFIAQEMQEVYEDAVGEDSDGFLTITGWSKTEARLVKAIQELSAKVSALENKS